MAVLQGWNYVKGRDTKPVILSEDVTEGQLLAQSDDTTSPMTVAVCGAGGIPFGVAERTVDISEDGTRWTVVYRGQAPMTAAAAITDTDVPLKAAAAGQVTPVTSNNDVIIGRAQHTASSGSIVLVDLQIAASYYGA